MVYVNILNSKDLRQPEQPKYRYIRPKKKKSLVSGNAGDEEKVHPGGRENFFVFLQFSEI